MHLQIMTLGKEFHANVALVLTFSSWSLNGNERRLSRTYAVNTVIITTTAASTDCANDAIAINYDVPTIVSRSVSRFSGQLFVLLFMCS